MQSLILYNPIDTFYNNVAIDLHFAPKYCPFSRKYTSYEEALKEATYMYNEWFKEASGNGTPVPKDNMLFQIPATIASIADTLRGENTLIVAGTGTGKTFMIGAVLDVLFKNKYLDYLIAKDNLKILPFPCLYVTVSQAIEQTQDVLKQYKYTKGKVFVINWEQLRSKQSFASILINKHDVDSKRCLEDDFYQSLVSQYANETDDSLTISEWNSILAPAIFIGDEIQKTKNNGAQQTKIFQAFQTHLLKRTTLTICASATPFVRPSESKSIVITLKPPLDGKNPRNGSVTNGTYGHFIKEVICGPQIEPEEYSPVAMERLTDALEVKRNIVQVTDVKFKHKTINKHTIVDFWNESDKAEYTSAYIEFLTKLALINRQAPGGMGEVFATITAYRKKADWLKRYQYCQLAIQEVKDGHSVIIATPYSDTHKEIIRILREEFDYKLPIAEIKGGQSRKERWANVNLFQDDKAFISVNMLQAGGVALSMHQYKPRNKRPRRVIMGLVWSIIEMLQVLGRAHRINSDSTTKQFLLSLAGTIEQDVSERLKHKAISARELLRKKETWSDLFIKESEKQLMVMKKEIQPFKQMLIGENGNGNDTNGDDLEADDNDNGTWNTNERIVADNLEEE